MKDPLPRTHRRLLLAGVGAAIAAGAGATWVVRRRGEHDASHDSPAPDLAAAEQQVAEQRGNMCTEANASGVGLRGEYYAAEALQGALLLERIDGPVDFDAGLEWPADHAAQRPRSVRWSGWVKPPVTGGYRFHAPPDGRVQVSAQTVAGAGAESDAPIELFAGRFYPVAFEVPKLASAPGRIRFEWTAPYGSRFVVPRALLFLPSDSVAPPKP